MAASLAILPLFASAQAWKPCHTHSMEEEAFSQNPQLRASFEQYNRELLQQANAMQRTKSANGTQNIRFIIPVVVHIIMPPDLGSYPWVPDEQVYDAIDILNRDFQKRNPDTNLIVAPFNTIIGNPQFEFRLATKDPNGNCTNGITRTISAQSNSAGDGVKDLIFWPTNRYYNVWIVNNIASGAGGYAYRPGSAPRANYEGVVCRASQFGTKGLSCNSNLCHRTFTHETGHYFNLAHTWGGSNTPGIASNCNLDDGIADTPNTIGVDGQACPLTMQSCPGATVPIANVQNYMDYADCERMFTIGQSDAMALAAQNSRGSRSSLWTPANLALTGVADPYTLPGCAPVPSIGSALSYACSGTDVSLVGWANGLGRGDTVNYRWLTPGANAPSYNGNPAVVRYSTPGRYSVQLITTTARGVNTSAPFEVYSIIPADTVLGQPMQEGFENPQWPNVDADSNRIWKQYRTNANQVWVRNTDSHVGGDASVRLRNRNIGLGNIARLESPNISTRGLSVQHRLFYKYAFAPRSANYNDVFTVQLSSDCGANWQTVKTISRTSTPVLTTMATGQTYNLPITWVPDATQWRTDNALLSAIRPRARFKIRFQFEAGGATGNDFYLDDINVGTAAVLDLGNDLEAGFKFSVYPNPTTTNSAIVFVQPNNNSTTVTLTDVSGRVVGSTSSSAAEGEDVSLQLNSIANRPLSPGVYFVKLANSSRQFTTRIVVQ